MLSGDGQTEGKTSVFAFKHVYIASNQRFNRERSLTKVKPDLNNQSSSRGHIRSAKESAL
jgi:hypothetical protein